MPRTRRHGLAPLALLLAFALAPACGDTPEEVAPTDTADAAVAPCSNGVRDADETGTDCGGACATKCDGAECTTGDQCASGVCTGGGCAPSPTKTCGLGLPSLCADGTACQQDVDCASDVCSVTGTCVAPPADVHDDGRRNGGETGKDCGGTAVAAGKVCPAGEPCKANEDCEGLCKAGVCEAPTASDGKKNQGESDVDCGGANAPACLRGKACTVDADCQLLTCAAGTCGTPSSSDGVRNGGESDVDCGGSGVAEADFSYKAPRCRDLRGCSSDGDCLSGACSPGGRCVPRSCDSGATAGITTCGTREVGDPMAAHESCCKSLQLPTRTGRRLDKYEITAGRFRTFLASAGPNVRKWVTDFVAANPSSQLAGWLATAPVLASIYPASQTGPLGMQAHMSLDIDNYNGVRGCYNGDGSYGHNTYWQAPTALAEYGLPARSLPQAVSDAKPLNCAMPIMFAAFCAWDGGELARLADYADAWTSPQRYPWGAADIKRPNYNWCNGYPPANGQPGTGGFTCQDPLLGDNGNFYRFPAATDLSKDLSPFIAAPGRFATDATSAKRNGESWQDLFANLAEYTGDVTARADQDFCDFSGAPAPGATTCTRARKEGTGTRYLGIPFVGLVGRSWEGHQYEQATAPGVVNAIWATFQYGKFGARCARPAEP